MTRFGLLAASALLLTACGGLFGGGPEPPPYLLTLTPAQMRPATPDSAPQGTALTVVEPTVPQALSTRRVPVYLSETQIQYLEDAQWVENPAPLFGRLVGEIIAARTGRVVLDPSQFTHDPGTRLTGQLLKFGLDPNAMEVVVLYDAAMARGGGGGIAANRFEARVPVAEASPVAVGPALNQAANQVAAQVASWIGS